MQRKKKFDRFLGNLKFSEASWTCVFHKVQVILHDQRDQIDQIDKIDKIDQVDQIDQIDQTGQVDQIDQIYKNLPN